MWFKLNRNTECYCLQLYQIWHLSRWQPRLAISREKRVWKRRNSFEFRSRKGGVECRIELHTVGIPKTSADSRIGNWTGSFYKRPCSQTLGWEVYGAGSAEKQAPTSQRHEQSPQSAVPLLNWTGTTKYFGNPHFREAGGVQNPNINFSLQRNRVVFAELGQRL